MCRPLPDPIELIHALELGSTGNESTRVFQTLSAGNIGQPPIAAESPAPPCVLEGRLLARPVGALYAAVAASLSSPALPGLLRDLGSKRNMRMLNAASARIMESMM